MNLSQIILIGLVLTFALYVFRFRTVLRDRLIYLFLIAGGLTFVVMPELSTQVANLVGIGRGTDLVLYAFIMFTLFNTVGLTSQLKKTDAQITALVRSVAIANARIGGSQLTPADAGEAEGNPGFAKS